jgi:hypothetical protein
MDTSCLFTSDFSIHYYLGSNDPYVSRYQERSERMTTVTFFVIRSKKDYKSVSSHSPDAYFYKKGWYVTRTGVKKAFKHAKFFSSWKLANAYFRINAHITVPPGGTYEEYFEIVPISVMEPPLDFMDQFVPIPAELADKMEALATEIGEIDLNAPIEGEVSL